MVSKVRVGKCWTKESRRAKGKYVTRGKKSKKHRGKVQRGRGVKEAEEMLSEGPVSREEQGTRLEGGGKGRRGTESSAKLSRR